MNAGKLEFLALKFRDLLVLRQLLHCLHWRQSTDILLSTKLSTVGHRWVAEMADINFDIKYRLGKSNIDADMPSPLLVDPNEYMENCTAEME